MSLIMRVAAATDQGLVRPHNEDAHHADGLLLAVADGIGGLPAGEIASELVIEVLVGLVERAAVEPDQPLVLLGRVVDAANERIRRAVAEQPEVEGMGTTLTAMLVVGDRIGLVHVGDSRAYLLRDGQLTQLTRDDTYVQLLVDRGVITPEEALVHPHRSVVTQALRGEPVNPTCTVLRPHQGDRYLLCSDGLSDVVSPEAIAQVMRDEPDLRACAEQLIKLALRAGGPDNITAVLADAEVA